MRTYTADEVDAMIGRALARERERVAHQHIEHCLWARNGNQPCPHVQPAQQQELCPSCKNGDIYACTCTFKSAQRQESVGEIGKIVMFGGDLKEVSWKNGNMPPVGSILYTSPPASKPKNVMRVKRISDQSVELVFTSCAAASEFIVAHGITGEQK